MSKIYIVRHPEVDQSVPDDFSRPLTEVGLKQKNDYAHFFKGITFDKIFSSNTIRTFTLAGLIAFNQQIPICVSNKLNERVISKSWIKGLNFGEFIQRQWDNNDFHLEGGESLNDVKKRLELMLREIELDNDDNLLMVTHAATLTELLKIFGVPVLIDDYINVGFGKVFIYDTNQKLFEKIEL